MPTDSGDIGQLENLLKDFSIDSSKQTGYASDRRSGQAKGGVRRTQVKQEVSRPKKETSKLPPTTAGNTKLKKKEADAEGKKTSASRNEKKDPESNESQTKESKPPNENKKQGDDVEELRKLFGELSFQPHEELEKVEIKDEEFEVKNLNVKLHPHQVHGLRFLKAREDLDAPNKGSMLCDDMGLGKTVQTIALMLARPAKTGTQGNLLVGPVAVMRQWENEIANKAPSLKTLVFHGPHRPTEAKDLEEYDVVITSYSTVASEKNRQSSPLFEVQWWRVILDEAHEIRNMKTRAFQAVSSLKSSRRLCLTGTPVQNKLLDMHALITFLNVSPLANLKNWISLTSKADPKTFMKVVEGVKKDIEPLLLRRTKQYLIDAGKLVLPTKTINVVGLRLSGSEKDQYDAVQKQVIIQFKSGISRTMGLLQRLRQFCCDFNLLGNRNTTEPKHADDDLGDAFSQSVSVKPELDALEESLANLMTSDGEAVANRLEISREIVQSMDSNHDQEDESGSETDQDDVSTKAKATINILNKDKNRKTVIFSLYVSMFPFLGKELEKAGYKFLTYQGKHSPEQRVEILENFEEDEDINVLLCSLKCAACGINLVMASRLILYEPWWNPAIEEQAIDRIYRIGQLKDVEVNVLYLENTIEGRIMDLKRSKLELAAAMMDKNSKTISKSFSERLTEAEVFKLLGLLEGPFS